MWFGTPWDIFYVTFLVIGIFEQIFQSSQCEKTSSSNASSIPTTMSSLNNEWNYISLQISTPQFFIPIGILIFPTYYVWLETPLKNWKTISFQKLFWVFIVLDKSF